MRPVIEIRPKWWQALITLPFIVLLIVLFYWFVLGPGVDTYNPPGLAFKAAAVFVIGVGTFLFVYFLRMAIKPRAILLVDEDGIVMNTGVTTGLIRWEAIDRVAYKPILTNQNVGPRYQTIVAVYLKDPADYRQQYNPLLRKLIKANEALNGPSIMIPFVYVKKQLAAFEEISERKTGKKVVEEEANRLL